MNRLHRVFIVAGLCLGFTFQVAADPQVFSWMECVSQVQKNNADLRSANATYANVKELEGVARSGYFPQIKGELTYSKANHGSADQNGTYGAQVSGTENLFNGLADMGRVAQAKANTRAALAALEITKARISFDLRSAYQGLLFAKEYTAQTAATIKRREENLRLVQLRFQAGRENKGSLLLSKASLSQARFDNLQARNAKRLAQAQLARALGLDRYADLDISGDIPVHAPTIVLDTLPQLAVATPDYRAAQAQEEASAEAVKIARAGFSPTLNLSGAAGNTDDSFFPSEGDHWSVGLNLTLPIFNGGKDYYGTRAASETRAANEAARINVSRATLARLEQLYDAFVEGVAAFELAKDFEEAVLLRAEIARKQYNNGLLSFQDWDTIESDLIARQKRHLETGRDRVLAEAAWDQALGKGDIP